jgi:two-component system sensor histidine kinase FlrB
MRTKLARELGQKSGELARVGRQLDVAVDAADGSVRFTVIDDGAGISADAAERALEPFFTTKAHGTGLGLAIANEIMKTHRGALSIGPAAPHGTRACLTLPIGEERAHAA